MFNAAYFSYFQVDDALSDLESDLSTFHSDGSVFFKHTIYFRTIISMYVESHFLYIFLLLSSPILCRKRNETNQVASIEAKVTTSIIGM